MEHYGKKQKLYHGIAIPFICMLVVPTIIYFLLYFPIKAFSKLPDIVIVYMCLGFTGIVGILFDMICIVNGFIHDQFVAFCMRVSNFFANVKIFKKKAYEWYWDDFKENAGIMIWLFLLIFLATVFVCVFGFVKFAMWYR